MNFISNLVEINNMKNGKRDLTTDILGIKKKIKRISWTIAYMGIREVRWNRYIHLKAMY